MAQDAHQSSPERIGILGGSFDPPHLGHLLLAESMRSTLGLAQVRFVPARQSPLKSGHHTSEAQRLAMLHALLADLSEFVVDPQELERPAPSYSADTVAALQEAFPGAEIWLAMGDDQWQQLDKWQRADWLVANANFALALRNGSEEATRARSRELERVLGVAPRYQVLPMPRLALSSTDLRSMLQRQESVRFLIPDGVQRVIAEQGLYRD